MPITVIGIYTLITLVTILKQLKEMIHTYMYSDASIKVYFLTEQGRWSHRHCSPIYLEVELPDTNTNNEKQSAYCLAVDALSDYLIGNKDTISEASVIETAKEYAAVCEKLKQTNEIEKRIRNPKSIADVLW